MVSKATHYAISKNGDFYKNTHISAATRHRTLNLVSNLSKDMALLLAGRICIISIRIFVNFNENIRKELKILKIQGGILTKLLLSLLIIVLE